MEVHESLLCFFSNQGKGIVGGPCILMPMGGRKHGHIYYCLKDQILSFIQGLWAAASLGIMVPNNDGLPSGAKIHPLSNTIYVLPHGEVPEHQEPVIGSDMLNGLFQEVPAHGFHVRKGPEVVANDVLMIQMQVRPHHEGTGVVFQCLSKRFPCAPCLIGPQGRLPYPFARFPSSHLSCTRHSFMGACPGFLAGKVVMCIGTKGLRWMAASKVWRKW